MINNRLFCYLALILIQLALSFDAASSAPEFALVTEIPGFNGKFPSKHYSGYVTIDENHGKKLYYYFVESERNPSTDPVVLWLNGGPGCSSFDGFVYEHGPFNFEEGKPHGSLPTLHLNPYSWSKVSSVLYLDSPAGVGLSYSANNSDYKTGDLKTATDSHTFLLKWFELYPEFLTNPFYIAGESYAGIYVPTLAYEVVKGTDAGLKPTLNFKGYLVGNGVCDDVFDGNALVPFTHGMGLISDELYEEVSTECHGNYYNPMNANCENKLLKVEELIEDLNIYDILEPCYHAPQSIIELENKKLPPSFRRLGETQRPLPVRKRMFGRAWPFRAPVRQGYITTWPELMGENVPCTSDEVASAWLNNEEVREAIHADSKNASIEWELCTDRLKFYHDAGSMIKYHKNLTSRGYRALIYSGDHDMCVPYTGTQAWTRSIGYKTIDEWRPWKLNHQVAGYTQGYDNNLTFITILGSGHTVPEYKPREALEFYSRWLSGLKMRSNGTFLSYLTLTLFVLTFKTASSAPEAALVKSVPGFHGTFPSKHYSGYVSLYGSYGKKLYYYFVESENNPSTDPVVLWLNGGPGCSSFDAFVYEHGPFNFEAGKEPRALPTLHLNPYSWSKVSSVIYLDSPAGVGFSYSGNESDYITGDLTTASDSHIFLLKWFELYPEFQSNPFYISGQSYAGIYVPTLAYAVAQGNDAGVKPVLNLKGYLVGNGVADMDFDGNSLVPFAHGMGLISDELFESVDGECHGEYYNTMSESCEKKLEEVHKELEGLNKYDILEPCYHAPDNYTIQLANINLPQSFRRLGETERPLPVRKRMFGRAWPLRAPVQDGYVPSWPEVKTGGLPCTSDEVATAWLTNEEVRQAIHAESGSIIGKWDLCTDKIKFYHDAGSMIKYHKDLTSQGYRALIYRYVYKFFYNTNLYET
ncbi:hypothetical protein ACS0TY_014979 [Phlomoides rotata]